jgi:hypothetical protein
MLQGHMASGRIQPRSTPGCRFAHPGYGPNVKDAEKLKNLIPSQTN